MSLQLDNIVSDVLTFTNRVGICTKKVSHSQSSGTIVQSMCERSGLCMKVSYTACPPITHVSECERLLVDCV